MKRPKIDNRETHIIRECPNILWRAFSTLALFALLAAPAMANSLAKANATANCTGYSLDVFATGLVPSTPYVIDDSFALTCGGSTTTVPGSISFTATASSADEKATGSWPSPLTTHCGVTGTATLTSSSSTVPITINGSSNPTLNCPAPPPPCSSPSSNGSNFNGTAIPGGSFIWFDAAFTIKGTVSDGTTLYFSEASVQLSGQGVNQTVVAPNAMITFSSSVNCTSTTFNSATQTWVTTVPLSAGGQVNEDEVFLDGLAFKVPSTGLPGGINNVVWLGNFSSTQANLNVQWKWGAAVYDTTFPGYNLLDLKAGHQTACGVNNGDHAGTPENSSIQAALIGGARGGGGSNFTGSWSGTVSVTPCLQK